MLFLLFIIVSSFIFFSYNYRKSTFIPDNSPSTPRFTDSTPIVRKYNRTTPTMFISAKEKEKYLRSPAWHILKLKRLAIANNCCEHCMSTEALQLHHIHYSNLTKERIEDLCILCATCHTRLHTITGYDRASTHSPKLLQGHTNV